MVTRALLAWFGLLLTAFANATVRELALAPRVGESLAHAVSSLTLAAAILVLSWFAIAWIGPSTASEAWAIGVVWLLLTLAFELGAGHYVFGQPWSRLWADYDVLRGRLWIVVLTSTLVAPVIAARTQRAGAR